MQKQLPQIIYSLFPLTVSQAPPLYKGGARAAATTAISEAMKMELVLVLAAIFCEYNNDFIVPRDIKLFSCNPRNWKDQSECSSCSSL